MVVIIEETEPYFHNMIKSRSFYMFLSLFALYTYIDIYTLMLELFQIKRLVERQTQMLN